MWAGAVAPATTTSNGKTASGAIEGWAPLAGKVNARDVVEESPVEWAEKGVVPEFSEKVGKEIKEDDTDIVSVSTAPPSDDGPSETGSTRPHQMP